MDTDILIHARENLLNEAVDCLSSDPAVLGIFLGGSLAAGTGDAFSDIDLRVVVTSDEHERFVANRLEIPKQWHGFLFNEWMPGAQHCVSHFRPFGKIDIFYHDKATLQPSPWYALPTTILYDPQGFIRDFIALSQQLRFETDLDKIDWLISKGLAAAHEHYRRVQRGELIYAQNLLDEFRLYVVQADDWANRRIPAGFPLKQEQRLTPVLLQALKKSYVSAESRAIATAMLGLLIHFRELVIRLHESYDLPRPLENDLVAVDVLFES
jgi:hypothetical protein